ncbi:LOW QUALITY PROTEIN: carcinoembryonic antigen-related cell adhesion molecule 8-like [Fukomys damarensis]|uniref:LOW QUALITY PROTEIN: carcinoembryonic antigen-related cell adhesion molecule 8-like n=1 Tax=Fukomys damarensis TaxID=885580 RepID=UPI0014551C46|nr:LOW QUALITY PROTEIN: carcinoembryonic antigen-related cell adhesion molecule 8-like [Fukomys damarensis]
MKSHSATSHRGFVSWQVLLWTASLLTSWSPPTTAQMSIEAFPFDTAIGEDVLLVIKNRTRNARAYTWYRGEWVTPVRKIGAFTLATDSSAYGQAYTRETIYGDGTMLLQNLTTADIGIYTVQIILQNFLSVLISGEFHLHPPVLAPSLQIPLTELPENDTAVLTCSSEEHVLSIEWYFNNQTLELTERKTLSVDNFTLTIEPFKTDVGEYMCQVSKIGSFKKSNLISLSVKYIPPPPPPPTPRPPPQI